MNLAAGAGVAGAGAAGGTDGVDEVEGLGRVELCIECRRRIIAGVKPGGCGLGAGVEGDYVRLFKVL
jgi:hypothetical protein